MVDLCATLDAGEQAKLRDEILGRARAVAEAAGGILGLVNRISPQEEKILQELAKPFER
jgi:hypothetical protein